MPYLNYLLSAVISLRIEQLILTEDTGEGFSEEVTFKLKSSVFFKFLLFTNLLIVIKIYV